MIQRVHVDAHLRLEVEPTAGVARLARTRVPFADAAAREAALAALSGVRWPRPTGELALLVDLRSAPDDVAAFAARPALVAGFARVAVLLPPGASGGFGGLPVFSDEGAAMRHLWPDRAPGRG